MYTMSVSSIARRSEDVGNARKRMGWNGTAKQLRMRGGILSRTLAPGGLMALKGVVLAGGSGSRLIR